MQYLLGSGISSWHDRVASLHEAYKQHLRHDPYQLLTSYRFELLSLSNESKLIILLCCYNCKSAITSFEDFTTFSHSFCFNILF